MICLVTRLVPPASSSSGAQAVLLARELRAQGDDVVVLAGRSHWRSAGDRRQQRQVGAPVGGHTLRTLSFGAAAARWIFSHRSEISVVHLYGGSLGVVIAGLAAQALGLPTLYQVTRVGYDDPASVSKRHLHAWREEVISRSLVVATTPAMRDACVLAGLPSTSVIELPHGIDLHRFRPPTALERRGRRAALGVGADVLVACTVGPVAPRTVLDDLLRAWASAPHPSLLLVLGEVLIEPTEPPSAKVRFVGSHPRPEEVLHGADLVVHLSTEEGSPSALLEAAACGLPAVARWLPGTTDHVVADGTTGLLVDGARSSEVAAAVRRLRDPATRQRMGAAATANVAARFGIEAVAPRYRSAYQLAARLPVGHRAAPRRAGRPLPPRTLEPAASGAKIAIVARAPGESGPAAPMPR